jgi:hypothetical protein
MKGFLKERQMFATDNVAHVFTKDMTFEDWKHGMDKAARSRMKIDDLNID